MKYLALGAAVAVLVASAVFAAWPDTDEIRSPREVVAAFVYHVDRGNFGKACGLLADEARGQLEVCSSGFVYNSGVQMAFFGADIYDGASLLPGGKDLEGDRHVYRIKTDMLEPVEVLVEKRPTGRYRIVEIG